MRFRTSPQAPTTTPRRPRPGPEMFRCVGKGPDLDEIRMSARRKAREFYGSHAVLEITHVGPVSPVITGGPFLAGVEIRCTNFAELIKAGQ